MLTVHHMVQVSKGSLLTQLNELGSAALRSTSPQISFTELIEGNAYSSLIRWQILLCLKIGADVDARNKVSGDGDDFNSIIQC
jgi:hypothetical protein